MQKAIFLDRDGTLNVDGNYVHKIDDFRFIKGVIPALRQLKAMGYLLVIVTNQSGIARGIFTEQEFLQLTEWMDWSLAEQGVEIDGIYYCPHYPQGVNQFAQECNCRKPKTELFKEAVRDLGIDLSQSIMVGDKTIDIQAGINAGIPTNILVRTGKALDKDGEKLATAILDSLADLPIFLSHN